MSILEIEYTGDSMPQGVVLCLVGKDGEDNRSLRMHNLASLISLAKWAVAHKVCLCALSMFYLLTSFEGFRTITTRSSSGLESSTGIAEAQEPSVGKLHERYQVAHRRVTCWTSRCSRPILSASCPDHE